MPNPSASSKFGSSILKFLGTLKFLKYTQNILDILKFGCHTAASQQQMTLNFELVSSD